MKTDSELQTDVLCQLRRQQSIQAAHIGVAANDNVVTLSGQVADYTEKAAAERAAKSVHGVMGLANDILVELLKTSSPTDQDVALAALDALKWNFEVPSGAVTVIVKDGWITLEGSVEMQHQKAAAALCIRDLAGVAAVTNLIEINPTVQSTDVKSEIEGAFRRSSNLDSRQIAVSTYEGDVTLRGHVSSWAQRDAAVAAAMGAPGVAVVDDQLDVDVSVGAMRQWDNRGRPEQLEIEQ